MTVQYVRPLVLIGLLKEAISSDLILEYPDLFANCLPRLLHFAFHLFFVFKNFFVYLNSI